MAPPANGTVWPYLLAPHAARGDGDAVAQASGESGPHLIRVARANNEIAAPPFERGLEDGAEPKEVAVLGEPPPDPFRSRCC